MKASDLALAAVPIIGSARIGPLPPRPLGAAGRALWDAIQAEYAIVDCGGIQLLYQCCVMADRAEQIAESIIRDGPTIVVRDTIRSHPGLRDELGCRAFICRTLERLGVTSEALKAVGRPAGGKSGWMETVK
jgi:hypothetical protein